MKLLAHIKNTRPGFTLLEILIAVSVFAVVLAAINTIYYGAVKLRNRTSLLIEQSLILERVGSIIKHDLGGLAAPGGELSGQLNTDSSTNMSAQGTTEFYTTTGILSDDEPWSEMQKVSYYLVQPTNNQTAGQDLVRAVTRNLLPTLDGEVDEQYLMSGLDNIAFEYYDGSYWTDTWDSTTSTNPLPAAIRVTLEFARPLELNEPTPAPVEFVVPVMVQPIVSESSDTSGGLQ